jgi:hypothetical protein
MRRMRWMGHVVHMLENLRETDNLEDPVDTKNKIKPNIFT